MNARHFFRLVVVILALGWAFWHASAPLAAGDDVVLGTMKANKILFLGNSITRHAPAPKLGWHGDWGMAASSQDKDYVHLVAGAIAKKTGKAPEIMACSIAQSFERSYAESDYDVNARLAAPLAFKPDVVVVAVGENVAALTTEEARALYQARFGQLLAALKANGNPTLFVRSCFWPDAAKDTAMRNACEAAGGVFVDMRDIGRDKANRASSDPGRTFIHDGVAAHPGDTGMQAIAERLFEAMVAHAKKP